MFQTTVDRIRLFFRKEKEPFLQLHKMLGFYPHNISLYREALLHKSYTKYRNEKSNLNNERLEFLGDAVLSAVVADILYEHYDNKQEGFLTTLRSKLVKRETLNKLAEQIGLDKFIQHIGPVTSAHNSYMGGNAFEALLGAIYLDRGYSYCIKFMQEQVFKHYIDMEKVAATEENFKSRLIEWCPDSPPSDSSRDQARGPCALKACALCRRPSSLKLWCGRKSVSPSREHQMPERASAKLKAILHHGQRGLCA